MSDITIHHEGSFWFVVVDGESLGHASKVPGIEGEPGWKSLLRYIFRPFWRASAAVADGYVHLEEVRGRIFFSRSEAIGAILAFHNLTDPRYPPPPD